MALITLQIPPGVSRVGTEYQSQGRWYDANLVRWFEKALRPVGGWRPVAGPITGIARGIWAWRDNASVAHLAVATATKLYVYSSANFDVTVSGGLTGSTDSGFVFGYGTGVYGTGTYGTPSIDTGAWAPATTWHLDNFGQVLLAVQSSDGRLQAWLNDLNTAAVAVAASSGTIPTSNRGVVVTEQRFCMLLGAGGNPRRVQWSDQEDYTAWAITATTQAGFQDLSTTGVIRTARRVRGETLILTSTDAHVGTYIGAPFVFGFTRVGTGCGILSPHAVAVADDVAAWMGHGSFFRYSGGTVSALPSEVSDFVYQGMNQAQAEKVFAFTNSAFGEMWWFYPSSGALECDRYVLWNYRENTWSIGAMSRTAAVDRGAFNFPLAVGTDGYIYEHEVGNSYGGAEVFCVSGPVEIPPGERTMMLRKIIPDERNLGDVRATFASRFWPMDGVESFGPYSLAKETDIRFTGRQIAVRLSAVNQNEWRVGNFRFDAVPSSRR